MEETEPGAQLYPVDCKPQSGGLRLLAGTEAPLVEPDSPQGLDLKLLRRAEAGDAKAFHALVDRHADRLFRLAFSLLGNAADAEDVVQETFAGAYRGIKGFQGRSSVGTWLTRILVTQTSRWRRDRKRPMASIEPSMERATHESEAGAAERKMDLQAAMDQLSAEHRQVLVLREFEHMSYDEIAQALDVPRGTVESRLHRARAELREKLKAYLP